MIPPSGAYSVLAAASHVSSQTNVPRARLLSNRKEQALKKKSTHLPYGCLGPFVEVCPETALLFTLGTLAMLEARERTSVPSIDHTILTQLGILH